MLRTRRLAWFGIGLSAVGVLPALWAAGEVTGGGFEVTEHWWSTLAILPLVGGIAVAAIGLARMPSRR